MRKREPPLSFGLLVILLPILPVMNLSGINESVFAERYLYLPSVGFSWIAAWMLEKLVQTGAWRKAAWVAAAGVLAVFIFMTMARIPIWKDDIHLYEATVRQAPDAASPHKYLAVLYLNAGRNRDAQEQLRQCLRLAPNDEAVYNNLGVTFLREHKFDDAMEQFHRALSLKPSFAPTYYNIGLAMKLMGRRDEAAASFRKALQLQPDFAAAREELAMGEPRS
jgi:tetratricopeptide (TPR) repeat protein